LHTRLVAINEKRLKNYFAEALKHMQLIKEAKEVIYLSVVHYEQLPNLEKFDTEEKLRCICLEVD